MVINAREQIEGGTSGGPIVTEDGKLVGIVSQSDETDGECHGSMPRPHIALSVWAAKLIPPVRWLLVMRLLATGAPIQPDSNAKSHEPEHQTHHGRYGPFVWSAGKLASLGNEKWREDQLLPPPVAETRFAAVALTSRRAHSPERVAEPHSIRPLNLPLGQRLRDPLRELRIIPAPPQ